MLYLNDCVSSFASTKKLGALETLEEPTPKRQLNKNVSFLQL